MHISRYFDKKGILNLISLYVIPSADENITDLIIIIIIMRWEG